MINKNSGFTLVEFMVAIVILMVGMLGMLQGINIAMSQNVESMMRNEATSLADELMLQKRAKSFTSISTTTANPAWVLKPRYLRGFNKDYSVQQIVSMATATNSKEIVINVTWNYKNKTGSHSVSSIVSTSPD